MVHCKPRTGVLLLILLLAMRDRAGRQRALLISAYWGLAPLVFRILMIASNIRSPRLGWATPACCFVPGARRKPDTRLGDCFPLKPDLRVHSMYIIHTCEMRVVRIKCMYSVYIILYAVVRRPHQKRPGPRLLAID